MVEACRHRRGRATWFSALRRHSVDAAVASHHVGKRRTTLADQPTRRDTASEEFPTAWRLSEAVVDRLRLIDHGADRYAGGVDLLGQQRCARWILPVVGSG